MKNVICAVIAFWFSMTVSAHMNESDFIRAIWANGEVIAQRSLSASPDSRIGQVANAMSMKDVDIRVAEETDIFAMYYPGIIVVDAKLERLPKSVIAFVLAHEYGHHVHAHWKEVLSLGIRKAQMTSRALSSMSDLTACIAEGRSGQSSVERHQPEFEADEYAVRLTQYFNLYNEYQVISFMMNEFGDVGETDSHPDIRVRLDEIYAHAHERMHSEDEDNVAQDEIERIDF